MDLTELTIPPTGTLARAGTKIIWKGVNLKGPQKRFEFGEISKQNGIRGFLINTGRGGENTGSGTKFITAEKLEQGIQSNATKSMSLRRDGKPYVALFTPEIQLDLLRDLKTNS